MPNSPDPYDAASNPDFLAAIVAYWIVTPGLVAISERLYFDTAPLGVPEDGPYVVLSQGGTRFTGRGSKKRFYWEETSYQFNLYHRDQDRAADLGEAMIALLDPIQDYRLAFANGKQGSWFRSGARLMEVPEVNRPHQTIWQQQHTYEVTVGRTRR